MQKRQLGKLSVSAMGLGCMSMSGTYGAADDQESALTLQRAYDLGITLFDTANVYGNGHNEGLLGQILRDFRHNIVLATKVGFVPQNTGEHDRGINGEPQYIKKMCEESLQRLNTDVIDLYYLHRVDPKVPVEESIGAMAELVQAGKVRHIGLCEVKPETLRRAYAVHPITAVQTEYSLWQRRPEQGILKACQELNVGFVPFSPLGRGFLTGKVADATELSANDFRRKLPRFQDENLQANLAIAEEVKKIAERKNCTPAQLALAWLLAQNPHIVPIPGTKREKYLLDNVGALAVQLTAEDLQQLVKLQPPAGEQYPEHLQMEG